MCCARETQYKSGLPHWQRQLMKEKTERKREGEWERLTWDSSCSWKTRCLEAQREWAGLTALASVTTMNCHVEKPQNTWCGSVVDTVVAEPLKRIPTKAHLQHLKFVFKVFLKGIFTQKWKKITLVSFKTRLTFFRGTQWKLFTAEC